MYRSVLPAAVHSSPFIPAAVLIAQLQVVAVGGTGSVVMSAGCPLAFDAVTRTVLPDLSTWAKPSGVLGLGLGFPGK